MDASAQFSNLSQRKYPWDLNGEVTISSGLQFLFLEVSTVENNLGLSKGDRIGEVTVLVRYHKPGFDCTSKVGEERGA